MKKLALALTTLLFASTSALACPDMESKSDAAPKTAEKDKAKEGKAQDKAKPAAPKQAEKPKTEKPDSKAPAKPSDKVSSK